jgi:hypothetical protein
MSLCRLYVDSFSSVYSRLDKGNRVCRVYVEYIADVIQVIESMW